MRKLPPPGSLFQRFKQPSGTYNPMGNRRVYQTKWLNQWVNWEREHGMTDDSGRYLESIRYREHGKHKRVYVDMSKADIDLTYLDDIQPFNPVDTKYMSRHYINGICLKDLAMMTPEQFVKVVNGIGAKPHRREK